MTKSCRIHVLAIAVVAACVALVVSCTPAPKAQKRLGPFATVDLPAVSKFVAAEHFVVNIPFKDADVPKGVMILLLDDEFRRSLLGKTEENVLATTLTVHTVSTISKGPLVLAELGDRAETNLAHLWALLERQPHGRPYQAADILFCPKERTLVPRVQNIFYIRGTDGILWAVEVFWADTPGDILDSGWFVGATPVQGSVFDNDWRIFSR